VPHRAARRVADGAIAATAGAALVVVTDPDINSADPAGTRNGHVH
jgi:hypothetical protein